MELLALVLVWPFLFLIVGMIVIALSDFAIFGSFFIPLAVLVFIVMLIRLKGEPRENRERTESKPSKVFGGW